MRIGVSEHILRAPAVGSMWFKNNTTRLLQQQQQHQTVLHKPRCHGRRMSRSGEVQEPGTFPASCIMFVGVPS